MKTYKSILKVPIEWGMCSDGKTLRSTVVGSHQAEIFNKTLFIESYQYSCSNRTSEPCGTRIQGMKLAEKRLVALLVGRRK